MATTKTDFNIKIDADINERASQIFARMGLDRTTAIDMFFRQVIAERQLPFQPAVAQTYGEQVLELIKRKNIPIKTVEVNEQGHIIVDKEKDPELYDWAVNG
jgi:DNA-damage-inducible protein J